MNFTNKSKGFSLIEVLIALVILAIALMSLTGLMVQSTRSNAFGSHMTEAATIAQDQLENLRVSPWGTVVTAPNAIIPGATGINYTRIRQVVTNGADTVKEITITITWTDTTAHSVTFRSVIFRPS